MTAGLSLNVFDFSYQKGYSVGLLSEEPDFMEILAPSSNTEIMKTLLLLGDEIES